MEKKLHILFLSHWFPSRSFPKNGNFILRHAKSVATLHQVTVLFAERDETLKSGYEIMEEKENNLRIIYVYFKGSSIKVFNYWEKFRAYQKGLKLVGNFDLIHVNILHYYAFIACYYKIKKKVNFVVTEHWTRWLGSEQPIHLRFYYKMMKIVCSYASYILSVSNDLADRMKEKGIKGNFQIIPNVVDTEVFYKKKENNEGKTVFLHISSLNQEHKNIRGILKVTKKLLEEGFDFILQIGGDGDISPIQEFIRENKLENNIFTFGELTEPGVAEKMRQSDYFVLFSNRENQPCVINESFSCGLPVISTRVGGVAEFFPDNFGILIEKGNKQELYKAMKNCLERKIVFADVSVMHQYAVEHFGVNHIAKEMNLVYQKAINNQ